VGGHDRMRLRSTPAVVELEVDRARVAARDHRLRTGTMPAHDEGARLRRRGVCASGKDESDDEGEESEQADSHWQSVRFRSMPRATVTVLIHTLDEIENIEACIRSVEWA